MFKRFIKKIYGVDGLHTTPYLTRLRLLQSNINRPFFQHGIFLHKFHRGDLDMAFHDHPWDYWTFPLRTYYEDILDSNGKVILRWKMQGLRWHFRTMYHTHRLPPDAHYPWYSLVLPGPPRATTWGFYLPKARADKLYPGLADPSKRVGSFVWVSWSNYIYNPTKQLIYLL